MERKTRPTNKSPEVKVVKIKTDSKFWGALKTFAVVGVIMLQLALLIVLYMWLTEVFVGYLTISFVLSLGTCLYVVSSDKNGYSKAVWTIFLLLFFYCSWFIYYISDERFFFKKSRARYKKIFKENSFRKLDTSLDGLDNRTISDIKFLANTAEFPTYRNCRMKYFSSGTSFFDDVLEKLKQAKKFIFIEYFIIADGVLLNRFLNILALKAKEGVDVRIIYDDMGSHKVLSRKTKKYIRSKGIKLFSFNRLVPIFNVALNYRDHRKIVVVDGATAYTGGANLADEYINERRMHGYWKDAGIRIDGQAVDSFSMIFLRQWKFLSKTNENFDQFFNHANKYDNIAVAIPYADGLDYPYNIGKNMYAMNINNAQKRIYIMTPYFVPEETILNSLKNKALAGVDVRIVLPKIPDKGYVYKVSINNAEKLAKYGVKVYTLNHSFVHSKVMLTDYSAIVGSINLDLRSFYQQFESALYTNDESVMQEIKKDFETTISNSAILPPAKNNLLNRMIAGLLRILSPLM